MRCVFSFGFALALSLALMAGCSDGNGEGGSGGTAGTGGESGSGGTAGTGGEGGSGGTAGTGGEGGTGGIAGTGGEGGTGGIAGQVFPCTEQGIRDAIAEGGGPHTFGCDGPTTVMTEAQIDINKDVILDGEGNLTVNGKDEHTVFEVYATVELRGLTVANGGGSSWGAIFNSGTLSLVDSIVTENTVYDQCGDGYCFRAGGIVNTGTLTLINSTVSSNASDVVGGILSMMGDVTLINSTVSRNTAVAAGGIYSLGGTLTLTKSTVSGNVAEAEWSEGGGIAFDGSSLTLTNSTVSGNAAGSRGGGIAFDGSSLTLTNSTVSGNAAGSRGGGIAVDGLSRGTLTFSTISGNTADQGAAISTLETTYVKVAATVIDGDCDQALLTVALGQATSRHNIESPGDTCGLEHETDQVSVTAEQLNLGPLQDNGGPTMTHALLSGSVTIDQIPEADCVDLDGQPLTTDQRGYPRPVGSGCDVGAFEVNDCTGVPDDTACMFDGSAGLCLDGRCLVSDCAGLEDGTGCAYVHFFTSLGWCVADSCELGECTGFADGTTCAFEDGTTGTCLDGSCEPPQ